MPSPTSSRAPDRPIILFGAPRTGTSIVFDALARHPDLAFPSQYSTKFPERVWLNGARSVFDNGAWRLLGTKRQLNAHAWYDRFVFRPSESYPLWTALVGEPFARGFLLDRIASDEEARRVRAYFASVVALQRRRRLAIKLTGPGRIGFLSSLFPDAVFVRVRRAPLPTLRSLLSVDFWTDREDGIHWTGAYGEDETARLLELPRDDAVLAALQLRKILETTDAELARSDVSALELDYERFVADPAGQMRRVLDAAGLAPDARVLDFTGKFAVHDRNAAADGLFPPEERARLSALFADRA